MVKVCGAVEPQATPELDGDKVNVAFGGGGAVSVIVIFLISIVCTTLSVGMFAIVRYELAVLIEGKSNVKLDWVFETLR